MLYNQLGDIMVNKKNKTIYYVILFILLCILGYLFIYTGDDWAWGSEIGLSRLNNLFKNYNSRYLGNLTVLLLTRSNILKGLVIGSTLFGIIFLTTKIINNKRFDLLLISTILILNTPKLIFREAISWTSGFSNYATSTFLILIFFYYIKGISTKKIDNKLNIKTLLLLILGITTNLFIEHVTIYNTFLSIFIIIYYKIKHKEFNRNLISYFIGSITGFLIMFINLSNSTGGNRNIANNIYNLILKICNNYFGVIYEELIYNNFIINILLISFIIIIIKNIKLNRIQKISFLISTTYIIYSILNIIYPTWNIFLNYTPHFEGIYTFFFGISTTYLLLSLITNKKIKEKIIFYILSIITITTPLLLVSPIGSRCFFITYILFILIVLELYNYLIKEKYINNITYKIFIPIIIISLIHLFTINVTTYIENKIRLNNIEKDIKNNELIIEIERFTYEDYIHGEATPTPNTLWEDRYKLFYNIPKNKKIKIKEGKYK